MWDRMVAEASASSTTSWSRTSCSRPPPPSRRGGRSSLVRRRGGARGAHRAGPGPSDHGGVAGAREAPVVEDVRASSSRTCDPTRRRKSWFWQVQDFAAVVERWGATSRPIGCTSSRCRRPGPRPALWDRFAGLLGLDPSAFDIDASRSNSSFGVGRRSCCAGVNVELGDRLPLPGPYPAVVKNVLAHRVLAGRPGRPLLCSPGRLQFALEESSRSSSGWRSSASTSSETSTTCSPTRRQHAPAPRRRPNEPPDEGVILQESVEAVTGLLSGAGGSARAASPRGGARRAARRARALRRSQLRPQAPAPGRRRAPRPPTLTRPDRNRLPTGR